MRLLRVGLALLVVSVFVAPATVHARGGRGYGSLQRLRQAAQAQAKAAAQFQQAQLQQQLAIQQAQAKAEAERKAKLAQGHAAAKAAHDKQHDANIKYLKKNHRPGQLAITPAFSPEAERVKARLANEPVVAPRPHFFK
jgi:hypothetical protein